MLHVHPSCLMLYTRKWKPIYIVDMGHLSYKPEVPEQRISEQTENRSKNAARYQHSVSACATSILSVCNPSAVTIEDHQIRFDYATPFTFSYTKILSLLRLDSGRRRTPGKQPFSYPHLDIPYVDFPVIFVMTFRELFELPRKITTTLRIPFIEPCSFSVRCHLR